MTESTRTATGSGRAVFWFTLLGASLITVAVTLKELGAFLGRMESTEQAYGASVFTGPSLKTADLLGAAGPGGVWSNPLFHERASALVRWHLLFDLGFAVLIGLTLFALLRAATTVRGTPRELARSTGYLLRLLATDLVHGRWSLFRRDLDAVERRHLVFLLPAMFTVVDLVENVVTLTVFGCWHKSCDFQTSVATGSLIHALSDLKWLLVAVNLLMIVLLFASARSRGVLSLQKMRNGGPADANDDSRVEAGAPLGVIGIVALFLVLLAVPAGGALDQFPDVLRGQFDDLRNQASGRIDLTWERVLPSIASILALLLFMAVVYLVSQPGTRPTRRVPAEIPTKAVFAGAGALTVGLFAVHTLADRTYRGWVPTLAPVIVIGLVWVTGLLINRLRDVLTSGTTTPGTGAAPATAADRFDPTLRARVTVALLVGGIMMTAGIGAVRALLPAVVANARTDWLQRGMLATSLLVATVVSAGVVWLVYEVLRAPTGAEVDNRWTRLAASFRLLARTRAAAVLVIGSTLVLTAVLMVDPEFGSSIGVPATLMIALSALCLLIGAVAGLTRTRLWPTTLRLHPGTRTPWMTLLVGAWILSNLLNTNGGYHDARTFDGTVASRTLPQTFGSWAKQWSSMPADCLVKGTVPLVLVAAPGGGGKAAYWTGIGMDALFSERTDGKQTFCPGSLFAASGVSGGAVGLTTRYAIPPASPTRRQSAGDPASKPVLADMTDDDALAATIGAMILRDLPASLASVRSGWRDRAAVLEDALAGNQPAFRSAAGKDGQKSVDELGKGWWTTGSPILMLNGTSVSDGCRALVTNVRGLPASSAYGCLGKAPASSTGTVSAGVDVLDGLLPSTGASGGARGVNPNDLCKRTEPAQTLRATTAGLLAARFPYVTPSGALRTCHLVTDRKSGEEKTKVHSSYVVDGGYLENTGMLSLLQLWEGTEDLVLRCNQAPAGPALAGCPADAAGDGLKIQPWVVLIENHYTSTKVPRESPRPHESLVPLTTVTGKRGTTLGTPALMQALSVAANRGYGSGLRCNFFLSLVAAKAPQVEAPLGWVLASSTRRTMDEAMASAYQGSGMEACSP